MLAKNIKTCPWGKHTLSIETGEIARQAHGSALVTMNDTVVLATVVAARESSLGRDFLPLTVEYLEKTYAAGKIPGGFFRREGRPSEHETLVARLIDRPIRPLFPEKFYNEVQIILHVLSLNVEVPADIVAMIAASAALSISGIPFYGPIAAARVGYKNNEYTLNDASCCDELDLVVAGTEKAILMVESQAKQLSEEIMLGAITYGHEQMQPVISIINELTQEAGKPDWEWQAAAEDVELNTRLKELAQKELLEAYAICEKQARTQKLKEIKSKVLTQLNENREVLSLYTPTQVENVFFCLEADIVRNQVLNGNPRIDGRDTRTVRPITITQGLLPRTHGSALFTRGETQALVTATLGTARDEQLVDDLAGEHREKFLLHYNMPPFATGEMGRVGTPKRREIGHGRLAKRALAAVLPDAQDFAYTIRVVCEITESNGSSSMASVCGGCLAMIDAGVPLKSYVAGVAMGLILDVSSKRFAVLTDILGDEDHLGDMDFKVAGTEYGITALQMDIKVLGINKEIMEIALAQAREGRLHILKEMQAATCGVKHELSEHAPRMLTMKIHPDKIRELIGKGGSTIQALTKETGASIDIAEDGIITISCVNASSIDDAKHRIEAITAEVEVGKIYVGTVIKLLEFGAIVNILPGKDGLLHISEIAQERVKDIKEWVQEGQTLRVKVLQVDEKGRLRLSLKAAILEANEEQNPLIDLC